MYLSPTHTMTENLHIGIAGLIGVGKTTLATALGVELGLPVYYEPVNDNPYLEKFYKNKKKYAYPLQIWLLDRRSRQQQQIIWNGRGGVQDRTIYEDSIFASMLHDDGKMSDDDYETYTSLFNHMSNFMKRPNFIIYLDCSPETSLERIEMRNRGMESGIPLEYLEALKKGYDKFIVDISKKIPVIRVDWSKFRSIPEMVPEIVKAYRELTKIHDLV